MGRDKVLLPVAGGTLIERVIAPLAGRFDDIVVSVSSSPRARLLEKRLGLLDIPGRFVVARDEAAGQGPLRGILTGLRNAENEACFVLAGDMPDVKPSAVRALVRRAAGRGCVIAVGPEGLKEPLFGVYKRSVIPAIEVLLSAGRRSVLDLYVRVPTAYVRLAPGLMPTNINTPAEYRAYLNRAAARRGEKAG